MKRSTLYLLVPVLLVLAGVSACKSQYEQIMESSDPDVKYNAAFDYFNAGKYSRAIQLFESLSLLTNGTERHDTVLYYLGLSNYSYRDYSTTPCCGLYARTAASSASPPNLPIPSTTLRLLIPCVPPTRWVA